MVFFHSKYRAKRHLWPRPSPTLLPNLPLGRVECFRIKVLLFSLQPVLTISLNIVYQIEVLITNSDFYLKQTNDCTEESYFELWSKIKCIWAIQRNCVHRRSQPWLKQTFTRWISFCSHTFYIITTSLCLKNVMWSNTNKIVLRFTM